MGVFKEHARAFEKVAMNQTRVFSDAADMGYCYNTENAPEDITRLIYHVNDLKGTSLMKSHRKFEDGVEVIIRIGWEIDEDFERGSQYTINFYRLNPNKEFVINKDCDAFISVDVAPYRVPYIK